MSGVGFSVCAPEPGVLGPMRGGELLVAFGALLLAVFVSVGLLKLTITSEAMTTAVPMPRIASAPVIRGDAGEQ